MKLELRTIHIHYLKQYIKVPTRILVEVGFYYRRSQTSRIPEYLHSTFRQLLLFHFTESKAHCKISLEVSNNENRPIAGNVFIIEVDRKKGKKNEKYITYTHKNLFLIIVFCKSTKIHPPLCFRKH